MTQYQTTEKVLGDMKHTLLTLEAACRRYAERLTEDFTAHLAEDARGYYEDSVFRERLERFLVSLDAYRRAKGDHSLTPGLLTDEVRRVRNIILESADTGDYTGTMDQLTAQWHCDALRRYHRFVRRLAEEF
jgi:AcrR family transcriptional regulator